ncbi:N-acetyltransferase [Xenorhabdus mauleonii]|uniref:N-acetyltransferase n=1 Tax=Xenorhabdus mauleonii TaxID=351675 RepID=A0A1I3UNB7_9GAMM|nr:hypothetical protein [Xenorhabdus mauleonii]PHM39661.1 N-acetyltransferase [Xenorhabdus mauleonii]SFJ83331.1 hypothetical protein SAMN05421680_11747 [Xenorhabdus mauleonii]
MLKRTNSLNSYIHKSPFKNLSRSNSFDSFPPNNIKEININYNNPKLTKEYIPSIIREVKLHDMINIADKIYFSIGNDGWFDQILNIIEDENDLETHINGISGKIGKTTDDIWDLKCSITLNQLIHVKNELYDRSQTGEDKNFIYFTCYIRNIPVGIMIVKCYEEVMLYRYDPDLRYYPEVTHLVMHPGLKNCAYLLMEKAVNLSYEKGCHGKLKLAIATPELSNVYSRMGFIHYTQDEMSLDPNGNNAWTFTSNHGGYRFVGTC